MLGTNILGTRISRCDSFPSAVLSPMGVVVPVSNEPFQKKMFRVPIYTNALSAGQIIPREK